MILEGNNLMSKSAKINNYLTQGAINEILLSLANGDIKELKNFDSYITPNIIVKIFQRSKKEIIIFESSFFISTYISNLDFQNSFTEFIQETNRKVIYIHLKPLSKEDKVIINSLSINHNFVTKYISIANITQDKIESVIQKYKNVFIGDRLMYYYEAANEKYNNLDATLNNGNFFEIVSLKYSFLLNPINCTSFINRSKAVELAKQIDNL